MNGVNILGVGHFSMPSAGASDLGTIIFMLLPPIGAEGVVFVLSVHGSLIRETEEQTHRADSLSNSFSNCRIV